MRQPNRLVGGTFGHFGPKKSQVAVGKGDGEGHITHHHINFRIYFLTDESADAGTYRGVSHR